MTTPEELFDNLKKLDIAYTLYEHPSILTVEEGGKYAKIIPGKFLKNFFLKYKKQFFLFVTLAEKKIDLKILSEKVGAKRLSFASAESLQEILHLTPGSVTPLAIINDKENRVELVVDQEVMEQNILSFHPLIDTATITITPADLERFARHYHHDLKIAAF